MTEEKICLPTLASERCRAWRGQGAVVFTNGCFDLLHLGHVDYLEQARALGSRLVVGVNSDASVRRLKGAARPLTDEYARCRVLAALAFVDLVVLFQEDTPLTLIETICPDILVKGDDYAPVDIVGADFVISRGGRVATVPLVAGYSTTRLLARITQSTCS